MISGEKQVCPPLMQTCKPREPLLTLRPADMQSKVIAAANRLHLGDMVPELVGPGLCFVGKEKDPAIVTQHLCAPESVVVRWKTPRDIADLIRGKAWHCTIQQAAGVVQGDDYGRNTLGKRKRNNGPIHTWLIDYGWAGHVPPDKIQGVLFIQLVGFFIEFIHLHYKNASPKAREIMIQALDIITSGRRIMKLHPTIPDCMVPMYIHFLIFCLPSTLHLTILF